MDRSKLYGIGPFDEIDMVAMNLHANPSMLTHICSKTVVDTNPFIILEPILWIIGQVMRHAKPQNHRSPNTIAKHREGWIDGPLILGR